MPHYDIGQVGANHIKKKIPDYQTGVNYKCCWWKLVDGTYWRKYDKETAILLFLGFDMEEYPH